MKKSSIKVVILLLMFNYSARSQTGMSQVQDTKMEIQSIDKQGKPFEARTSSSFMYLSISSGDFTLKTDINTFQTDDLNLDTVLVSNGSQPIIFKSNILENITLFTHNDNDEKMYDMKGTLTINGTDIPCVAQYDPQSFGNTNDRNNYRLDFRLYVDANKVNIKGLETKLNKQVLFEIARGMLNITN
jgi:hypothetical protein